MEWFKDTFGRLPPNEYTEFISGGKYTEYENLCYGFVNENGDNDSSDIHYWLVQNTEKAYEDQIRRYEQACDNEIIDSDYLPIIEDSGGNLVCLSMKDDGFGKVYFAVHDSDEPTYCLIADTFAEFLNMLYKFEDQPHRMELNGFPVRYYSNCKPIFKWVL